MKHLLPSFCLLPLLAFGAEPSPPATQISQPVSLVAAEAFNRPEAFAGKIAPTAPGWRGGIGTWSIRDGAAYAVQEGSSEKRPNGHEAVCEHVVDLGDYLLTADFKLGTAPQIGFVCRDTHNPNHHQGRVVITPTAIWIQKMSGIAKETRREELTKIPVTLDPNTWYKITVEVCGDRFLARVGDHVLEAKHERFRDRKGRIGFVARGEGAQFRAVSLWSARPKP